MTDVIGASCECANVPESARLLEFDLNDYLQDASYDDTFVNVACVWTANCAHTCNHC